MAEPFIGEIRLFSFGTVPRGWAPCNGQIMQVNTNQALFTVLGNRFGGDGKDTFALPDLRGRTPVDVSPEYPIGTAGGEAEHTLTINEIPEHTHEAYGDSGAANAPLKPSPSGNVWGTTAASRPIYASSSNVKMNPEAIGSAGGGQAHNNMQPYTAVSFCIALQGIYPPKY